MKKSIGIDVAKAKLDISIFDGEVHQQLICGNTDDALSNLIWRIDRSGKDECRITMEATGSYHLRAAARFHEAGYTVSVVNPLIIKRYGEMKMLRAKTDPVDARLIAEYGYEQGSVKYEPKEPECQELVYLLRTIAGFHTLRTQNKNRIEALSHSPWCPPEAMTSIRMVNKAINTEIKKLEQRIMEIIRKRHEQQYSRLIDIPGIGNRLASAIIGYFGQFEQFETSKQVACFIGVNPSPKLSGTSIRGHGTISRKGNRYLRKLFYMAALSACRHNHDCARLYNRLLSEGKKKKVALIAVANKLIRQVFSIVKYQREYIPNYQSVL